MGEPRPLWWSHEWYADSRNVEPALTKPSAYGRYEVSKLIKPFAEYARSFSYVALVTEAGVSDVGRIEHCGDCWLSVNLWLTADDLDFYKRYDLDFEAGLNWIIAETEQRMDKLNAFL